MLLPLSAGGAPQASEPGGRLPRRLALLSPRHQQLRHAGASGQEEKGAGVKGQPRLHAQGSQTPAQHLLQRRRQQRGESLLQVNAPDGSFTANTGPRSKLAHQYYAL